MLIVLAVVPVLALTSRGESQAEQPVVATPPTSAASTTPQLDLIPADPLATSTPAPSTPAPSTSAPPAGTSAPAPSASPKATPTPAPPVEPVPCTDEMLALAVAPQDPEYAVDADPVLLLTVANVGTGPCTRDVGEGRAEYLIFEGDTRLWGSNDCIPGEGADVRALQPDEQIQLSVRWAGLTAEPGCAAPREQLAPGNYTLRASLDTAQSPDGVLTLTPP